MQDALPLLQQAHENDPLNNAISRMLADVSNETGHPDAAEPLYVALLKDSPKDAQLLASYGACLVRQKRYFEAEPPLEQAVQLKSDLGDAWGSLAFADSKLARYEAVLHDLTERKKTEPDNASTYFLLGTAYDKLRRTRQAAEAYRQFLATADGKFADQEFQVRERLKAIERTGK
jgi:Flp pilus assembly protein TadD